eukprot:Blabericola_migrator_1__6448@NODE_3253_length_1908_cov_158_485606_g2035_i0_p2_GENE_NODE_3253_length_1908_cov_158_485606_g2035_i0NODE_3253_length_1908_cov_158_485606_g2035_i0_p2_ORF_typecomplete_len113_score19_26DUF2178/PF09946_9/17DUF2178/PF09946_9/19_NODE_3253_length_1908_cov_158_485606_g2035_i045383
MTSLKKRGMWLMIALQLFLALLLAAIPVLIPKYTVVTPTVVSNLLSEKELTVKGYTEINKVAMATAIGMPIAQAILGLSIAYMSRRLLFDRRSRASSSPGIMNDDERSPLMA